MTTIEVVRARPPELGRCRAAACRKAIEWVTTVATGRRMPVDAPLLVERVHDRPGQAPITVIDAARSHFVSCPAAADFKKGKRP